MEILGLPRNDTMRWGLVCLALLSFGGMNQVNADQAKDNRCYELRIYTAAPGKLEALNKRFREHTCKLFEKHGMTNVGYWVPTDKSDERLFYILSYPSREARAKSWAEFMNDSEWLAAKEQSEKDGKLVAKAESEFLHATDYSPAIKPVVSDSPRVFELRTYTTTPGNLSALNDRFRNHTIDLFSKHGMGHFGYWILDDDQMGAKDTLIYLLYHKSKDAAAESFKAFGGDPAWKAAKDASEKKAGGSLTTPNGVKSLFLVATDYSPTK